MKPKNIPHIIDQIERALLIMIGKIHVLKAMYRGVQLGTGAVFIGTTHFRRYPGTKITIGNRCTFLSKTNSNLIGINRPCMISTLNSPFQATIIIGNNCGLSGTVIGAFKQITIGDDVKCGANTLITDSDWHPEDPRSGIPREVVIEKNVWIGVNCVILKGVTIGENTIIGANSVVVRSIPANVVAAGNPCKTIRPLILKTP